MQSHDALSFFYSCVVVVLCGVVWLKLDILEQYQFYLVWWLWKADVKCHFKHIFAKVKDAFVCVFVFLSTNLSIRPSVCLSIRRSVYLSIRPSTAHLLVQYSDKITDSKLVFSRHDNLLDLS